MVNEKYYELFKNIAHTVETTSEQVMEYIETRVETCKPVERLFRVQQKSSGGCS